MMIAITTFIMSLHAHLNRVIAIAILYQKARLHTMACVHTYPDDDSLPPTLMSFVMWLSTNMLQSSVINLMH